MLFIYDCDSDFQIPVPIPSLPEKPVQKLPTGCNQTLAMEQSVQELVYWLKSEGFEQDVCDKFIG